MTVPVVIVDLELRIRRFTPPAQKLLNLLPGDVGRRLNEIRPNLSVDDLGQFAREAIDSVNVQEREVREKESGAWYQMWARPYKTWDNKIDGAVLSFENIDALKREIEYLIRYGDALIDNTRGALLILDADLRVVSANQVFCRTFQVTRGETEKLTLYELGDGQWNIPRLRDLLEKVLPNNGRVEDYEVRHSFPHLGERTMMLNAHRIEPQPGKRMILLSIENVT